MPATRIAMKSEQTPAQKALHTAKWGRIMTKWLISRSSKDGVKWQVVSFNGAKGHESKGIVDMIAIRKNHRPPEEGKYRGDLFEIVLIQVKGGKSAFPSPTDVARLEEVRKHHNASKVVLAEWKKGERLCCHVLPEMTVAVDAKEVFGNVPSVRATSAEMAAAADAI
jgi:hypothetical protein